MLCQVIRAFVASLLGRRGAIGFGIDLVYGAVAAGGIGAANSSNEFWLSQAYIAYMVAGATLPPEPVEPPK